MRFTRRGVLGTAAALAVAAAAAGPRRAAAQPPRGEYLIRRAHVLTMDDQLGDLPSADVHVRDGRIAAVDADGIDAPGSEVVDGRDMLLLPGLVETHWHLWTTLLRSMAGNREGRGYFPTSRRLGAAYVPSDMYHATRLATTEALHGGITFVHDWCHNVGNPEFAAASLTALAESGIRARFSYGTPTGAGADQSIDMADLERLHAGWDERSGGGRLGLGLAWRGPGTAATRRDYAAARELGLPVSVHVNNFQSAAGGIAALDTGGFLGPHVQLIHAIWSSPEEIAAVAAAGASLSLSPYTELRIGFGFPKTLEYLAAGVPVGLSVDTPTLSGNADMFAIMKAIQNVANARALNEFALPARRVLELATIDGARSMGLGEEIGSVTPGKRADLIMIDTRQVNLAVVPDPVAAIVEAAQPANVDTVFVDGRIVKRNGMLSGIDVPSLVADSRAALAGVRRRAAR